MMTARIKDLAPYLLVLGGAIILYYVADHFTYDVQAGRLGPDGWPKLLLLCLGAVAALQVVRRLLGIDGAGTPPPVAIDTPEEPEVMEEAHPLAVAAAVLVTVLYLATFEVVGFFLGTFLYVAALMWIGNFRSLVWVPLLSLLFSLAFMFAFMRVIFVDLPLGTEPFSRLSSALLRLMGVH